MGRRIFLFLFSGMCFAAAPCWPSADSTTTQATFSAVTGKVTLQGPNSKKKKTVHPGSAAREEDRITTGKDSSASLALFDGSQLQIGAQSSVLLTQLQKPSPMDKIMKFKLLVGRILAQVKKLASSKSSFEIQAGGVVCGVRGTTYIMFYQPVSQTLDLSVSEGTVYAQVSGGPTTNVTAGKSLQFTDVPASDTANGNGSNGKKVNITSFSFNSGTTLSNGVSSTGTTDDWGVSGSNSSSSSNGSSSANSNSTGNNSGNGGTGNGNGGKGKNIIIKSFTFNGGTTLSNGVSSTGTTANWTGSNSGSGGATFSNSVSATGTTANWTGGNSGSGSTTFSNGVSATGTTANWTGSGSTSGATTHLSPSSGSSNGSNAPVTTYVISPSPTTITGVANGINSGFNGPVTVSVPFSGPTTITGVTSGIDGSFNGTVTVTIPNTGPVTITGVTSGINNGFNGPVTVSIPFSGPTTITGVTSGIYGSFNGPVTVTIPYTGPSTITGVITGPNPGLNGGVTLSLTSSNSVTLSGVTVPGTSNLDNLALTILDSTFQSGILVNGENGLIQANRNQSILLLVNPNEAVP